MPRRLRLLAKTQARRRCERSEAIQQIKKSSNRERQPAVYILASRRNGTPYVGVTSNLIKRVWEHKNDFADGFVRRYRVHMLVYDEILDTMNTAIAREKQIKAGSRLKKLRLIESMNPEWNDLYGSIA